MDIGSGEFAVGINTSNTDMHSEDEFWEKVIGMCMPDTDKDKIANKLLLLYLIDSVNKQHAFLGITKLQKLVFLVENELYKKKQRALSYPFFRWDYGPMSKEIYVERKALAENGLIGKEKHIQITKKGKDILSQCFEILEKNQEVLKIIDRITKSYSVYEASLKDAVYDVVDPFWNSRVRDIPQGFDLLINLFENQNIVEIDNEWVETLDIMMDKEAYASLIDAIKDAQVNKSIKYEELFGV